MLLTFDLFVDVLLHLPVVVVLAINLSYTYVNTIYEKHTVQQQLYIYIYSYVLVVIDTRSMTLPAVVTDSQIEAVR